MASDLLSNSNSLISFEISNKEADFGPDKSKVFYCEQLDKFY